MRNRGLLFLVLSGILTIILYHLPWGRMLAWPLLLISTVAHEMGHGLMAMLLGNQFTMLEMHPDGSGVAHYSGQIGRVGTALVAAAGLVGPALVACLGFQAGRRSGSARAFVSLAGLTLLLAVILVVRGGFAVVSIGALAVVLVALGAWAGPATVQFTLIFLCVQLSLSVFSRADYLFTASAGSGPSDVAVIASALFFPYWFWGLVCGGLSVAAVVVGVLSLLAQE